MFLFPKEKPVLQLNFKETKDGDQYIITFDQFTGEENNNLNSFIQLIDISSKIEVFYIDKEDTNVLNKDDFKNILERGAWSAMKMSKCIPHEYETGFYKFVVDDASIKRELEGVRLAYSVWEEKIYKYSNIASIENICAFKITPKEPILFNDGFTYPSFFFFLQQTFDHDLNEENLKQTPQNLIAFQKMYNEIYLPLKELHANNIIMNERFTIYDIVKVSGQYKFINFRKTQRINLNFEYPRKHMDITKQVEILKDFTGLELYMDLGDKSCKSHLLILIDVIQFLKLLHIIHTRQMSILTTKPKRPNDVLYNVLKDHGHCLKFAPDTPGGSTIAQLYKKYVK